jgi:hypothetical protein
MNFDDVMRLIGEWGGTMKYFPSDSGARLGIAKQIASMASNVQEVNWLVARVPQLFVDWPGMREVRAVFCSRFRPLDGVDVYSDTYLDGIPSERTTGPETSFTAIPEGAYYQICGEVESQGTETADPEFQESISVLHRTTRMAAPPPIEMLPGENDLQALMRQCRYTKGKR